MRPLLIGCFFCVCAALAALSISQTKLEAQPAIISNIRPTQRILIATMLTDSADDYGRGAVALIRSIKARTLTETDFRVLELDTKPILNTTLRHLLQKEGWTLTTVQRIPPRPQAPPPYERFADQFTKLHIWNLVQYDRVLYLDSDCLAVGSLDAVLSIPIRPTELWATRDIIGGRWTDGFNMGVFMVQPSAREFQRLMRDKDDPAIEYGYSMAEQGFLNVVYRRRWRDFGFRNNANLAAYLHDPVLWGRKAQMGINVIHYTLSKPWACSEPFRAVCGLWDGVAV